MNWQIAKKAIGGAFQVTVMMFIILAASKTFAQVLAFSGATGGLSQFAISLPLPPIAILIAMQVILLILGSFMEVVSIMMITLPIFMPVVAVLGFNPVWFGVIYLLNIEMATTTPPFGLTLFVMKGVAPPDTTMGDIYKAALPFLGCDLIAMILIIAFPIIALWLPGIAH